MFIRMNARYFGISAIHVGRQIPTLQMQECGLPSPTYYFSRRLVISYFSWGKNLLCSVTEENYKKVKITSNPTEIRSRQLSNRITHRCSYMLIGSVCRNNITTPGYKKSGYSRRSIAEYATNGKCQINFTYLFTARSSSLVNFDDTSAVKGRISHFLNRARFTYLLHRAESYLRSCLVCS
jgi:hypothetical protein